MEINGRYTAKQFSAAWGSGEPWGVVDNSYLPEEWVLDWRMKGTKKLPWRGSEKDAKHLAEVMSKNHPGVDFVAKGDDLSLSQLIHYAKLNANRRGGRAVPARKTARSGGPAGSPIPAFKKCDQCGVMYRGERHC